jgi:hypothetical protein
VSDSRRGKPTAVDAAAPEDIVVNRARGRMLTHTATELRARDLAPILSDEPPSRGGENRGPSPLELVLFSLCACTNVTTGRMAAKLRFRYSNLETEAEGELDTRGRKGTPTCLSTTAPCACAFASPPTRARSASIGSPTLWAVTARSTA